MKKELPRRGFIAGILSSAATFAVTPLIAAVSSLKRTFESKAFNEMSTIKSIRPMGFQWDTTDPFLFCVHHEDFFPKGNEQMGPDPSMLEGRHMGDDFIIKDGFRMYHGKTIPGFPGHPHRGFETITIVRKGLIDHADSMGAAGRYGDGDVQWMTAGKGVQHSEMFPLIHQDKENTTELFQIWLNLPKKNKMVNPHFKMLWKENIPNEMITDNSGKKSLVEVIAGRLNNSVAPLPPPDSWAADPANEVAVWNIKMEAGAVFHLPKVSEGINRTIYFYEGELLNIAGTNVTQYHLVELQTNLDVRIKAESGNARVLLLQGKPIGEQVMQYGPFVMNTKEEINQAFQDYHTTQFGGWPWPRFDQVHPRDKKRFAKHADGSLEEKDS